MRPGGGGGFRSTLEGVADVKNTTVNPRAVTTVVLNNLCQSLCSSSNSDSDHNHPEICSPVCTHLCPSICYTTRITSPSSLPPAAGETKPHISSIILGVSVSLMAIAFLFFAFLAIRKVHAIWRRNRRRPETVFEPDPEDVPEGFVDHPIWYIRTVGLQPSIINGIAVVKYRKDIALIEGTDCVVCLSEFQDDEDLRLLPKCNHAFHLPCLDTWLRSHTNCPICRAGVTNSASTVEITVRTPSVVEETRVDIHGGDDEIARESDGDSMSENVKLNENMSGEDGVGAMDSNFFAGTSNSSSSE